MYPCFFRFTLRSSWIAAACWSSALLAIPAQGDGQSTMQEHPVRSSATDDSNAQVPKDEELTASAGPTVRRIESDGPVEEVVVTGERIKNLTSAERREIYRQLSRGRSLYSKNEFKRAFPLLLNTAEHGFKSAQARVGFIYMHGLGEVPRDSSTAIGWLGAAASGNSSPGIQNYFNDIWDRIPEKYVPYFQEVVEEYESKYGEDATGVTCAMRRPAGSHLKQLSCYFERDLTLEEGKLLDDFFREVTATRNATLANPAEDPTLRPVTDDLD